MRIIGGEYGGRKINPPGKMPHTRPTTDIAKEGLFNIIENNLDVEALKTLDLFGGTGSISYELASRGAKDLTIAQPTYTDCGVCYAEDLEWPQKSAGSNGIATTDCANWAHTLD